MPDIVIVAYKPKPGQAEALARLAASHHPRLAALGLVTDRAPVLGRAGDGTIVEVFEWRDGATERAHEMAAVQEIWAEYSALCEYVPLASLSEAGDLFATFAPLAAAHD